MYPISNFLRNCKFVFLLFFALFFGSETAVFAQQKKEKAPKERKPFKLPKFSLDAVRIGADLTWLGGSLFIKDLSGIGVYYNNTKQFAVTVDAAMFDNRLFVLGEVGYSDIRRNLKSVQSISPNRGGFSYDNTGWYWRAGLDYNLMWKNFKKDAILVGLRYGTAYYKDVLDYGQIATVWDFIVDDRIGIFNRYERLITNSNNAPAQWFELTTGLRVTVWRNIQLGYTFRYKFLVSQNLGSAELVSNEVPGYGTTNVRRKPAFSYHVYYYIPLPKKAKPK